MLVLGSFSSTFYLNSPGSLAWGMMPPTVGRLSHVNLPDQSKLPETRPEPISPVILNPIDLSTDTNHHEFFLDTLGWGYLHPTLAKAVFSTSKSSRANSLRVRVLEPHLTSHQEV